MKYSRFILADHGVKGAPCTKLSVHQQLTILELNQYETQNPKMTFLFFIDPICSHPSVRNAGLTMILLQHRPEADTCDIGDSLDIHSPEM